MKKIFVLGSLNIDLSIGCDYFPIPGETVIGRDFISNPGGKGANQAVAAAKAGATVIMLGAVGNDFFGKLLKKNLQKYNINNHHVVVKNCPTGVAIIIINDQNNRIVLDSGANYQYEYADFAKILTKLAKPGDYFVTQLENRIDVVKAGLALAKKLEMVTVLNPAPAFLLDDHLLNSCDYIIPNENESYILSNLNNEKVEKLIKYFLGKGIKNVIITLGEKGCAFSNGDKVNYVEAKKTIVVDTTAAGDTFIGSLVAKLAENCDLETAVNYANVASALAITRQGAQQSIPTRQEVEKHFKN
ncbi:MAG: ribokinase [Bacilli bacterium]|jgi:ribokinase|nr:ribokinase [Bacilli bacterium]MDD4056528.1 ribokinase [Bacilli bacterium]MDY0208741.1 ribokinase [Bacilli bacterium]